MYNMSERVGDLEIRTRNHRGVWLTEYVKEGRVVETFSATTSPDRARKNHLWVVAREQKLLNSTN